MINKAIVETLRPEQWYKNLLIYVPLVISLHLFNLHSFLLVSAGFVVLCMSSSTFYIVNDLVDYKRDHIHPEKSKRPIASGRLSKKHAIIIMASLVIVADFFAYLLGIKFLLANSLLITLGFAYSLKAREVFVLDAFLISINYILRAVSGSFILEQKVTPALLVGVFFLALFLTLGKRKTEISYLKDKAIEHRNVLQKYSSKILDYSIVATGAIVMISYSIYCINGPEKIDDWRLVLTIPLAFFILVSYAKKVLQEGLGGKELNHLLISDKKLIGAVIIHVVLVIVLLYFIPSHYFK